MVHCYLPLSWPIIAACAAFQAVCFAVSAYCVYQWYGVHGDGGAPPVVSQCVMQEESRDDYNIGVYAHKSGCRVVESADSIKVYGSASALVQFTCACFAVGITYSSYIVRPSGKKAVFCMQVVV